MALSDKADGLRVMWGNPLDDTPPGGFVAIESRVLDDDQAGETLSANSAADYTRLRLLETVRSGLTLGFAASFLKKGWTIRRGSWPSLVCLRGLSDRDVPLFLGFPYQFSVEELDARDWEAHPPEETT